MPKSCASSFIACLLPLLLSSQALAQVEAKIEELNAQALEAYQNLDIDTAGSKLEEALGLAEQSGYTGPEVAATYMNLGIIYVTGVGDPDQALSNFVSALCIQNDVQLDPLLSTPDVQLVFEQAMAEAQGGACGGGGPAAQPQPSYQELMPQEVPASAGPRMIDDECPPGIKCGGEDGDEAEPTDWAPFFFSVGVTLGNTLVQSGMEADSRPPLREVIDGNGLDLAGGPPDPLTGAPTPDGFPDWADDDFDGAVGYGDLPVVDPMADPVLAARYAPYLIQIDTSNPPDGVPDLATVDFDRDGIPDNRYFFDDKSAWVPDADSFDDFQQFDPATGAELIPRAVTPVSQKCEADGTRTGPLDLTEPDGVTPTFTSMEPSKYCVRVETVGFVQNLALRLNPGYFIGRSFALSLPVRIQFDAGEGTLSNMLLGLRGELLFSEPDAATGFPFSFFFGATVGQIQAKPPPADANRPAPYVISGPIGGHVGFNWRARFDRNFGLFISPEVDVQFPAFLLNVDATVGAEVAF